MFASVKTEYTYDWQMAAKRSENETLLNSEFSSEFSPNIVDNCFDGVMRRALGILDRNETLRKLGYAPIISTASGAFRVAKSVFSLFLDVIIIPIATGTAFKNEVKTKDTKKTFKEFVVDTSTALLRSLSVNVANIARGIIEMVPVAGNLAAWGFDTLSYKYRKWQNGILSDETLEKIRSRGQWEANRKIENRRSIAEMLEKARQAQEKQREAMQQQF